LIFLGVCVCTSLHSFWRVMLDILLCGTLIFWMSTPERIWSLRLSSTQIIRFRFRLRRRKPSISIALAFSFRFDVRMGRGKRSRPRVSPGCGEVATYFSKRVDTKKETPETSPRDGTGWPCVRKWNLQPSAGFANESSDRWRGASGLGEN